MTMLKSVKCNKTQVSATRITSQQTITQEVVVLKPRPPLMDIRINEEISWEVSNIYTQKCTFSYSAQTEQWAGAQEERGICCLPS